MVSLAPKQFDTKAIREDSLQQLLGLLRKIPGTKHTLVLKKSLSNRLNLLTPFNVLKEQGNVQGAIWLDEPTQANVALNATASFVLLCDDALSNMSLVEQKCASLRGFVPQCSVHLIVIGELTADNEAQLAACELDTILRWPVSFCLLDNDLLSLEAVSLSGTNLVKQLYLSDVEDSVYKLAKQLLDISVQYPTLLKYNTVLLKGDKSMKLYEVLKNLKNDYLSSLDPLQRKFEESAELNNANKNDTTNLSDLVILERSLDFVTPLLSQLTYLGLLDEVFEIDCNRLRNTDSGETVVLDFANDSILDTVKDLNFAAVGPALNSLAKELQTDFDQRHNLKNVSEIKDFVGKLSGLQKKQADLNTHTNLAESILLKVKGTASTSTESVSEAQIFEDHSDKEQEENEKLFSRFLETQQSILDNYYDNKKFSDTVVDLIYDGLDVVDTLRLCCLFCKTRNGINEKSYALLKNEIVQNFGVRHIITLQNLKKLKLFYVKKSTSYFGAAVGENADPVLDVDNELTYIKDFAGVKNYLNLSPVFEDTVDESMGASASPDKPFDANFAFPGYVPITTRLVQSAFDRHFLVSSLSSLLMKSSSRHLTSRASWKGLDDLWKLLSGTTMETSYSESSHSSSKYCFVVMIGGITYGEVATLRYVQKELQRKGVEKEFVIVSDGILNGRKLIESAMVETTVDV